MRHWYWNHCGKKEQWFVNKIIMINYIIIAIGQRHFINCKARFFQNLSTFLGCSCSVYFKMDGTWHHRELVLSLRSYWCHSNHGIAHASDTTIIRFASTHNVHKHCAQCARQLNSNFSLTLAYLNLLAVNNQALENKFILFLTGGLFFQSWTLPPTQLTFHVTLL